MFESDFDSKQRKRGSYFVMNQTKKRSKQKNPLYINSSNEEIQSDNQDFQHRTDLVPEESNIGDSLKNLVTDFGVKSRTVVIDKKNGHFSRLKNKNSDYQKFLVKKSKNLDVNSMKFSIEKIQAKIEELTKTIEAKTVKKNHSVELMKINKPDPDKKSSGSVDWKNKEATKALAVGCSIIVAIFCLLCYIEGQNIFKVVTSMNFRLKSKKPTSWFDFF